MNKFKFQLNGTKYKLNLDKPLGRRPDVTSVAYDSDPDMPFALNQNSFKNEPLPNRNSEPIVEEENDDYFL